MHKLRTIRNCQFLRTKCSNNRYNIYLCGDVEENNSIKRITTSEVIGISIEKRLIKTNNTIYQIIN